MIKVMVFVVILFPLVLFAQIQTNTNSWVHKSGITLNSSNSQCVRVIVVGDSTVIIPAKDGYSETLARLTIIELPISFPEDIEEIQSILADMVLGSELTEEEFLIILELYPSWQVGNYYQTDDVFKYGGDLYKVNQPHTSQSDWIPGQGTDALYSIIAPEGVILEWVQPQGAHDAYNIGDLVQFNGSVYESVINDNVWSPAVYPAGWELIE